MLPRILVVVQTMLVLMVVGRQKRVVLATMIIIRAAAVVRTITGLVQQRADVFPGARATCDNGCWQGGGHQCGLATIIAGLVAAASFAVMPPIRNCTEATPYLLQGFTVPISVQGSYKSTMALKRGWLRSSLP